MKNEFVLIAYLLKNRRALKIAKDRLKPQYFSDRSLKVFYSVMLRSIARNVVITFNILEKMLREGNHKQELYDCFAELMKYQNTTGDEFLYSLRKIVSHYKKRILIDGVSNLGSLLISNNVDRAENQLKNLMADVEAAKSESSGITLNLRDDVDESIRLYQQIENDMNSGEINKNRIKTGYNYFDSITGGGKRGELWVLAGYSGDGKTQLSKDIAYRVCTQQSGNVLFISLEMSVEEIKCLVETRHSHNFIPGGIAAKRLELGTLSAIEKDAYQKTLDDWRLNTKYGKFVLWSPPYGCTVNNIVNKMEQVRYDMSIELVVIDYAELVNLDTRVSYEKRIQVAEVMRQLKDVARTFDNNRGVWILTPHQISRSGKNIAEKAGYYELSALAESAGVERNANLCCWTLITDELRQENKVRIGINKYRTGIIDRHGTEMMSDFAHSMIEELCDSVEFNEQAITS